MPVHHVGELVVTVHQARDEVERLVGLQPVGGHVESIEVPVLDPVEESDPPVDLTFVEAVRTAEIVQPPWLCQSTFDSSAMPSAS